MSAELIEKTREHVAALEAELEKWRAVLTLLGGEQAPPRQAAGHGEGREGEARKEGCRWLAPYDGREDRPLGNEPARERVPREAPRRDIQRDRQGARTVLAGSCLPPQEVPGRVMFDSDLSSGWMS